jgi:hypothetical protein
MVLRARFGADFEAGWAQGRHEFEAKDAAALSGEDISSVERSSVGIQRQCCFNSICSSVR